ncbi:hypothetical protein N0V90_013371 [Kalmusia sp. IMI 367209]|nr:hypothetical protein N0V90_013371 [Kalmusia sp. IMI 367209]
MLSTAKRLSAKSSQFPSRLKPLLPTKRLPALNSQFTPNGRLPLPTNRFSAPYSQFQSTRTPRVPINEESLGPQSQKGKVFAVTGGTRNASYELSRILYGAGARVYIMGPSKAEAEAAIQQIEDKYAFRADKDVGSVHFIPLRLEDLESVQSAAMALESKEDRLDGLFCNASTPIIPGPAQTEQGFEWHLGVNCIGHVLLENLLRTILSDTAQTAPQDSVRVLWSSDILVPRGPPPGGITLARLNKQTKYPWNTHPASKAGMRHAYENYAISKAAMWFAASQLSKRWAKDTGVLNVAAEPGTCLSLYDEPTLDFGYHPGLDRADPNVGALKLWMGLSKDVTMDDAVQGRYAVRPGAWERHPRQDLVLAQKGEEEGGTGKAKAFMDWVESMLAPYTCRCDGAAVAWSRVDHRLGLW